MPSTYRTGNSWGVTIVREAPASHAIIEPDQLVAVVVNGDLALAERICALLNAGEAGNPHGYHPTCIDISTIQEGPRSAFVCGPDCPPPPAAARAR